MNGKSAVCFHLNETKVLSQLEIQDELKKSAEKEHVHLMTERAQLKFKMSTIDEKFKRARDLLLDLSISKDEYNEIKAELEIERHNIDVKLQSLSNADDSFNETIGTIFELASKAQELFKSSQIGEKRRIITLIFPNLKTEGESQCLASENCLCYLWRIKKI